MARHFARALLAAALAFAPVGGVARAQSPNQGQSQNLELRGASDGVGGFPTAPSDAPLVTPGRLSSPSLGASPITADDQSPPAGQSSTPAENAPQDTGAPNYGKKRQPKPNLYKPNSKLYRPPLTGPPPLTPLEPYRRQSRDKRRPPGQEQQRQQANPQNQIDPVLPPPTQAALPGLSKLRLRTAEDEPFDPIGVRAGNLIFKPFVEASGGYESNPNQQAGIAKPSSVIRTDAGFEMKSDFSTHSLSASMRGGYSEFPQNSNANRPDLSLRVDGGIDVTRTDKIDTEARLTLATQTPGSPLLAVPNSIYIVDRPLIVSEGATLGGTHLFGPLAVGLKGTFDRTQFGDARQSDGSIYPYSTDNYNDYGLVARASYELTQSIIPFAEIGADSRQRDRAIDISGYERNSAGGFARAGATVDLVGYLSGTASAGYLDRHYEDSRLQNVYGPTVDAALIYKATPLTTLKVTVSTVASETTLAGASGAISRSFSAELSHVFFQRFTLTGIATFQPNQYIGVQGNELYTTFALKGAYSLSRDVQLIASASHQMLKSSFYGQSFRDNVGLVGIRLQR